MRRLGLLALLAGAALAADPKKPLAGEASNAVARLEATLYLDKASIREAVGEELGEGIVVFAVKLTPLGEQKLNVNRDDFLIRSDKDGQRGTPYSASQIAGSSVMVVSSRGAANGGVGSQTNRPTFGGLGGPFGGLGGNGGGFGSTATVTEATAEMKEGDGKRSPLLDLLEKKILPEPSETSEPVSGQLYFLMEGKQKAKDLELLYKTAKGRLSIRFRQ